MILSINRTEIVLYTIIFCYLILIFRVDGDSLGWQMKKYDNDVVCSLKNSRNIVS